MLPQNGTLPRILDRAMRYSLFSGGKRVRPILALASGEAVGAPAARVLPFACALEMIHSYSLIHDDLPAMDDDDLRRGKPTNHIVFGEGMAILAGDGLLTEAFRVMAEGALRQGVDRTAALRAVREGAAGAGAGGMVGGRVAGREGGGWNPPAGEGRRPGPGGGGGRGLGGGGRGPHNSPASTVTAAPSAWPFRWPTTFSTSKAGPTRPASAPGATPSYTK